MHPFLFPADSTPAEEGLQLTRCEFRFLQIFGHFGACGVCLQWNATQGVISSTEDHQPHIKRYLLYVIESEGSSFSEMFAGGSWLVDRKRNVRFWVEQSSYDLPEELLRKGIA